MVNLNDITPSSKALDLAIITHKDARFIELVLRESKTVLRAQAGTLIVEHRCGFVCANAGIDHSNVEGAWGNPEDWVLLLPENPDRSADNIRQKIEASTAVKLGSPLLTLMEEPGEMESLVLPLVYLASRAHRYAWKARSIWISAPNYDNRCSRRIGSRCLAYNGPG